MERDTLQVARNMSGRSSVSRAGKISWKDVVKKVELIQYTERNGDVEVRLPHP